MLFQELDKLKRTTIVTSMVLMSVGILMLICPVKFVDSLISALGYAMILLAGVWGLDFIVSRKALINVIYLCGALIIGLMGVAVLVNHESVLTTLGIVFGILLLVDSGNNMFKTFTYVKRSQRPYWWVLAILSLLQLIIGLMILVNPWWNTPHVLLRVIGTALLFSVAVGVLRMLWMWPIKAEDEE